MGEFNRYPLGVTVVAVTTLVFCLYTIVSVSTLVGTVGSALNEGCTNAQTESNSFLEELFKSIRQLIEEDQSLKKHGWLKWLHLFETSEENCEEILQPVLGTLIAWDVIIAVLFLLTILLFVGIMKQRPNFLLPYLAWLGIIIVFVFSVMVAIATRFPAPQAGLVISCAILFLIVPAYYWMVTYKHKKEASKTSSNAPSTQTIRVPNHNVVSRKDAESPVMVSGNVSVSEFK